MGLVADFLDRLADDVEFARSYDLCTEDVMNEFGLDEDQKKLIRDGTPQEVREYLMGTEQIGNPHVYILRMLPPIG